ncbi:MAG: hypothetical protein SFT91_04800 [Rickettsiaceae bacterium]|nr:hypothetical protein [Rickettsiaceae bacterium]
MTKQRLLELDMNGNDSSSMNLGKIASLDYVCKIRLPLKEISENMRFLFENLHTNSSIICLDLSMNPIFAKSEAASLLADCLKNSPNILYLNLSICNINDVGIRIIKDGLFVHKNLRYLSISCNILSYSASFDIKALIKNLDHLEYLDISHNFHLGYDGLSRIGDAIAKNHSLRILGAKFAEVKSSIHNVNLRNNFAIKISYNKSLIKVISDFDRSSIFTRSNIIKMIKNNPSITSFQTITEDSDVSDALRNNINQFKEAKLKLIINPTSLSESEMKILESHYIKKWEVERTKDLYLLEEEEGLLLEEYLKNPDIGEYIDNDSPCAPLKNEAQREPQGQRGLESENMADCILQENRQFSGTDLYEALVKWGFLGSISEDSSSGDDSSI